MTLRKRRRNFLNLLQKEVGIQKGGGGERSLRKGGGIPTLEETVLFIIAKT